MSKKLVNSGIVVNTKAYGEVTIREFNFRQLNGLIRAVVKIFRVLPSGEEDMGSYIFDHLDDIDIADALEDIQAVALEQKKPLDLSLTEGMKVLQAIIELNDWKEIKEVFFGLMEKVGATAQE